jgi:hypothetical protein
VLQEEGKGKLQQAYDGVERHFPQYLSLEYLAIKQQVSTSFEAFEAHSKGWDRNTYFYMLLEIQYPFVLSFDPLGIGINRLASP